MLAPTLLLAALVASTDGGPAIERLVRGEAFDLRTRELLYVEEHHERWREGRFLGSRVVYRDRSGATIREKWLVPGPLSWCPGYESVDPRSGSREAALAEGSRLELASQRSSRSTVRRERAARGDEVVVDAGLHPFVDAHWDRLLAGETLRLRIPVPWRLTLYDFRLRRVEAESGSPPSDRVTLELTAASFVIRLVLDPIRLVYEANGRRLVEQTGRTGLTDDAGDPIVARVAYSGGAPLVPPAETP